MNTNPNAKFDLEKAKAGQPICYVSNVAIYSDGPIRESARIICYDYKNNIKEKPLLVAITRDKESDIEYLEKTTIDGINNEYAWLEMEYICTVECKLAYIGDTVWVTNLEDASEPYQYTFSDYPIPEDMMKVLSTATWEKPEPKETWQLMFLHNDSPYEPLINSRTFKSETDALNYWNDSYSTEYFSVTRFVGFTKNECKLIRPVKTSI